MILGLFYNAQTSKLKAAFFILTSIVLSNVFYFVVISSQKFFLVFY